MTRVNFGHTEFEESSGAGLWYCILAIQQNYIVVRNESEKQVLTWKALQNIMLSQKKKKNKKWKTQTMEIEVIKVKNI